VRLDRNQRQNRAEKMLKRNIAHSLENMQQRGEFGRELYRGRGGQII